MHGTKYSIVEISVGLFLRCGGCIRTAMYKDFFFQIL